MSKIYYELKAYLDQVRKRTDFVPRLGIVLGSGLGGFAEKIDPVAAVNYSDIDGFPVSTVSGHTGRFIFGNIGAVPVVAMEGRVHYYEGYSMRQVAAPVRLMGLLGAEAVILTNAAGGVNPNFSAGDLMAITGHISSFVPSPLIGENAGELGTRFPDMTEVYDCRLLDKLMKTAKALNIGLKKGVYLQTTGPAYETPEEIRMFSLLGADAVGMSTVCEAIAARHMGLKVCGISCITNMAAGISGKPLNHNEVKATADKTADDFGRLLYGFISSM